jgi:16S rRNA (guanine966-N2)-methyltransferase
VTRIIGGSAGGQRIEVPAGRDTRPTADRVREALFSRLEHDGWLDGTRVLDLYAGSGALGIEAASRGAGEVLLVEHARPAVAVIRRNLAMAERAGLVGLTLRPARVAAVLARPARRPYDLVLADPPYALPDAELAGVLAAVVDGGWLADSGLLVVERSARGVEPRWPAGIARVDDRAYGEVRLWFAEAR